ncbi:calcium-binding mitochondrial carrier protein SCaMC-1-like isoform X1 [Canis lupus familiaris]|uniref:calcium-binding mitochondrial carrier protein SCaMC-1-like isoform X1 n=2 Tax=Canis lupus familiaris TaxID=9615 RepID=UPI0003ADF4E1|nr:calcium-binding mitochondrial carrier protein SCaMC-1-like isoform X1 [Canis lupus familiaris]XP_038482848.1 calcium-binding mitochondrial carrier protein SCaMC-1-like isoform X1 [Canis lupus familiaris]XP_038482858.1 calcium-binding mitochondrial carrier protein SCaMC-1-like isoform X1 [Canis lupus familiaris]|eukprot:XP_013971861.1 calcium-binding mitochondrial carrier protein SCaMC-1-like isoform X1 [Canis lupus familiaris]
MSGIKSLSGGMVDVNKLDTVLGSMGMSLTEEELKDLTQNLPENVDRKVDLKQVMDAVKSFTGEKVDINNLENLLRNMGIELADTEYTKLVKARPLSANGKLDLSKVMDGVKAVTDDDKIFQNRLREVLKSLKDGKIYTNDLSAILDNMGVKISNKDLKALTKNFPADVFCESF